MAVETTERFIADVEAAGLRVEPYAGRFFWRGPAVRADTVADVMSVTTVRCQHDSMGMGVIVYPETPDREWFDAADAVGHDDEEEEDDDED